MNDENLFEPPLALHLRVNASKRFTNLVNKAQDVTLAHQELQNSMTERWAMFVYAAVDEAAATNEPIEPYAMLQETALSMRKYLKHMFPLNIGYDVYCSVLLGDINELFIDIAPKTICVTNIKASSLLH